MSKLVSILIPAYNAGRWISQTIESALKQTWGNNEIIIIDDGSTDNTFEIAHTYENANVKVLRQENQGAPATRNNLYEVAQGSYIQWLDADDLLDPRKITIQMEKANLIDSKLVLFTASFGSFYYRKDKAVFRPNTLWQDLSPIDWVLNKFNDNVWLNPTSWLVSRELTEMAGPWNEYIAKSGDDDGEYICRIIKNCEKVRFVHDAKCYYRIGNLGSLNWSTSKAIDQLFLSLKLTIEHLLSLENSSRTRQASLNYLQIWYGFFYPDGGKILQNVIKLANDLGGQLKPPKLKWKYLPFKLIFGDRFAKNLRVFLPKTKTKVFKEYDHIMYNLQQIKKAK